MHTTKTRFSSLTTILKIADTSQLYMFILLSKLIFIPKAKSQFIDILTDKNMIYLQPIIINIISNYIIDDLSILIFVMILLHQILCVILFDNKSTNNYFDNILNPYEISNEPEKVKLYRKLTEKWKCGIGIRNPYIVLHSNQTFLDMVDKSHWIHVYRMYKQNIIGIINAKHVDVNLKPLRHLSCIFYNQKIMTCLKSCLN